MTIRKITISKIQQLPESERQEVIDFFDRLAKKREMLQKSTPQFSPWLQSLLSYAIADGTPTNKQEDRDAYINHLDATYQ